MLKEDEYFLYLCFFKKSLTIHEMKEYQQMRGGPEGND